MAEAGGGHAARPTLVHDRGDTGSHAHHIGVQAEAAGDVLIDMGVRVDHPGSDDLARDIDHLLCGIRGQRRFDRRDATAADGNIRDAVATRRGIDHPPATQQQIELAVHRIHLRALSERSYRQYAERFAQGASGKGAGC